MSIQVYKPTTRPSYDWDAYYNGNPIQKWWKRRIVSIVTPMVCNYRRIIDVGCGSSPLLSTLTFDGLKVGLDVDFEKIKLMRSRDGTSSYWLYDGVNIPFPDNHFDVALSLEVIEHLTNPEVLISQLSRIASERVIIATPDFSTIRWNLIESIYRFFPGYHCEHITKFSESSLIALCLAYGLNHQKTIKVAGCDMVCLFSKRTG